jgi:hypothetical protein
VARLLRRCDRKCDVCLAVSAAGPDSGGQARHRSVTEAPHDVPMSSPDRGPRADSDPGPEPEREQGGFPPGHDEFDRLAIFAGVPAEQFATLDPAPEVLEVLPGEVIVREGRYDHEWYVILDGVAMASIGGDDLGRLSQGEHFGEVALLSRRPRRVTMRAVTPMRVLMLTEKAFLKLLEDCPRFTHTVLARLAERAASPGWPVSIERPTIPAPPGSTAPETPQSS